LGVQPNSIYKGYVIKIDGGDAAQYDGFEKSYVGVQLL